MSIDVNDTISWCEEELAGVEFGDARLDTRLIDTAIQLSGQPLSSINQACGDWVDTKAAYRLFDNEKVTLDKKCCVRTKCARENGWRHVI